MRRCLYVLLILLLPLRGWVGDAMATQMSFPASAQHAPAQGSADHGHGVGPSAHAHPATLAMQSAAGDCSGHAVRNDVSDLDNAAHCGACAMCQTCNTLAVLAPAEFSDAGLLPPAVPLFAANGFTSADAALVLKPPEA